jgi:2-polyprenyl-3-methyl-5-hydroxy-6-metoxy-1,4-benzoquinol methylase
MSSILSPRFSYDTKALLSLNPIQEKVRDQIAEKIRNGYYSQESVPCAVCEKRDFETLSERDRFGLPISVVICQNCGLIQTNPHLTQEAFNEFYRTEHVKLIFGRERANADLFLDEYYHGQKIFRILKAHLAREVAELYVVEIGCGAGGIIAYFRDQGCDILGVDLDADCIAYGREHHHLNLQVGSLRDIRFERQPDVIIMSHVLEHLLHPMEELSFIRSILAPQGLIYVEVPGVKNLTFKHDDMNFLHLLQVAHIHHFSLTTLSNLMGKAGFRILKGNERIASVFQAGDMMTTYRNAYQEQLVYLRKLEIMRRYMPLTPFRIRNALETTYLVILRKTHLYSLARKVYHRLIHRTQPQG